MITRILSVAAGIAVILAIMLARGLPVLALLKALPLLALFLLALALIYAGVASDSD